MATNNEALTEMTSAVNSAVAAIQDLATKAAAGQDISAALITLATNLKAAVTAAGEPVA